jgi:hypothetical protein
MIESLAFLALLALLTSAWCALVTTRSTPARLVRDVKMLRVEVERLLDASEAMQTRWAAKTHELEHLADQITSDVERAEKKRRQASGAASRALRNEGPTEGSLTWARQKARDMGLN